MKPKLRGDFTHSIGEVVTIADYEQMMYDIEIRDKSGKPEDVGDGPVRAKEEPLGSLRESDHG